MLVRSSLAFDNTSLNMRMTLLYIILVLCGVTCGQLIPSISVHPADAVVREGSNHVLHCAASTDVGVQISWAHNGVVIEPTADTTRELLSNNSLRILNVEASTKGLYACRVSNDVGTVTSRQASLQIARLNGSRQPSRQSVTRLVGDSLQLNCGEFSSVPEASITWVRRDPLTDVQKGSLGDNVVTSISGILYFRSLKKSHNDLYRCSVENSVTGTTVMGSYILSVNDSKVIHPNPQIALPPTPVVVNRGDNVNFQCITEGSSLPTIAWSRIVQGNNSLLPGKVIVDDDSFILTVIDVQPADVGDYICNASDGVNQLVATLKIRDAPLLSFTPDNNTHSVKFGEDLQLSCSANGTLPIKLTWFRNGVQLVSGSRVVVEPLGGLTIHNTSTSSDAGIYQCYAENEAGFTNYTVSVDVFTVPPSFTVGLTDIVVFEGDQLSLECQAIGAPPPQYAWYRGNIPLDSIDQYDTSTPGMLKMSDVSRDQDGTYNCSVSSTDNGIQVGRNSTTARVFVVSPSVFVTTTSRQLAEQEGQEITLPCSVTSEASSTVITYSWRRDNQPVVINQRVSMNGGDLVISNLQPSDAGRYTCVVNTGVTNSVGAQPRELLSNISILSVSAYPVAPRSPVAVEVAQSFVLLEWSYEGDKRQISHFQVERQQFGSQEWKGCSKVGALATTQINVTDLYPFTAYQFRVLSFNNANASSASEPSELVVTREAAPTASPINVIAVESNYTAIAVEWEHPPLRLADGTGRNGIIVSYEVAYIPVGGSSGRVTLRTGSNATMLKISDLEPRLVYEVSIAAITSQGIGPAVVVRLPTMGAVTGTEDSGEEFHEQTWFIVVVVLVGLITVTFFILMVVCVVRSVRNNKSNEGKYNVEGIKDGHITTGVLNKDVVEDYENRRTTHIMKYSLSNDYRSNASLITDNVIVETQSNAASTLPAPPYIPPPSFGSLGHCSSFSTIDRPVMSRSGNGWNNYVLTESSDVFEEACSSIGKAPPGSESDEYDGKCSSVSTSNKCATFV